MQLSADIMSAGREQDMLFVWRIIIRCLFEQPRSI